MALPSSGPISMSMVRTELELGTLTNFRLNGAEICAFTDLNNLSISQSNPDIPNIDTPNSASEWYGYDHKYKKTLNNNLSFNNILAPYGNNYSTFTTIDINETENLYINFTGSDFVNTGTAPNAAVSYSLYYSTYSADIPYSKLIKNGVLKSASDTDSFYYEYNSDSGSNVTWIWRNTEDLIVPEPVVWYDSYYGNTLNYGTGGSYYDAYKTNAVTITNANSNNSYYSLSTQDFISSSNYYNIGAGNPITVHIMYQLNDYNSSPIGYTPDILTVGARYSTTFMDWMNPSSGSLSFSLNYSDQSINTIIYTYYPGGGNEAYYGNGTVSPSISENLWYSYIFSFNPSLDRTLVLQNSILVNDYKTTTIELSNFNGPIFVGRTGIPSPGYNPVHNHRIGFVRIWNAALTINQMMKEFDNFKSRYNL